METVSRIYRRGAQATHAPEAVRPGRLPPASSSRSSPVRCGKSDLLRLISASSRRAAGEIMIGMPRHQADAASASSSGDPARLRTVIRQLLFSRRDAGKAVGAYLPTAAAVARSDSIAIAI